MPTFALPPPRPAIVWCEHLLLQDYSIGSGREAEEIVRCASDAVEHWRQSAEALLLATAGQQRLEDRAACALPDDGRPIWERIESLADSLPDELLDDLPTDGAAQHDHYLYGSPKCES